MSAPQISVLLPTYNRANYIGEAIQSALDQTFRDFELIVVDDGSTDETSTLVERMPDPRIHLFRQENRGISAALNTALRAARGQYIAILNSDDRWLPDLLARELAVFEADPELGVVYSRCQAIDAHGRLLARTTGVPPRYPGDMFKSLLYGDHVCTIAVLMRRDFLEQVGGWDERLIASEDWDLWLRLAQICRFAFVDAVLAHFREHSGRTTSTSAAHFARLVSDRVRVLDKIYARPDVPPAARSMRSQAYANISIDVGLRWLKIGNWRAGLRAFLSALLSSPSPLALLVRIVGLVVMQAILAERGWGVALIRKVGQWRRQRRSMPAQVDAPACPICGATRRRVSFSARDRLHGLPGTFQIVRCACGLRATLPQPEHSEQYYPADYYAYAAPAPQRLPGEGLKGALRMIVLYYQYGYRIGGFSMRLPDRGLRAAAFRLCAWLLQRLVAPSLGPGPLPYAQPGGRVLDIGCGNGAWLLQMQALGWQAEGVEVSAQACAAARHAGLTVYAGSLADAALPGAQYDVVRIWHALEHIPEPAGVLHEVARVLKPGGQLLIGVPNAGGWLARLWGTYWFDLDAPRHLWHLAAPELRRLAEQAGLRVVAVATQPSGDYALLWSLRYYAEELGLRRPDDRRGFDAIRRWLHTARGAAVPRILLGILERGNALVLLATRPGQRS